MGKEPTSPETSEELTYYRTVEDHFCRLRGTPFLFSPKDFAYLRRWWRESIPLSAVLLGITEVFARKRQKGEDPVSSLAYCRHAVARHAKRLAQARAGAEPVTLDVPSALADLRQKLATAHAGTPWPRVRDLIGGAITTIENLPQDLEPATLAEMLAELEEQILREAWAALPVAEQEALLTRLREEFPGETEHSGRAWEVALLRAVREALGLPRLELVGDGP